MAHSFSCQDDFVAALQEVDILVTFAESHQKKPQEYAIFNKACLLFLVAKFEVFLESAVSEYTYKLETLKLPALILPETIKLHCCRNLIDEQFLNALAKLKPSAVERLKEISVLWDLNHELDSIKIDNNFDYGKHGQNAIVQLFARIGIEDVFQMCPIFEARESMSDESETKSPIDIVADINSMTGIRNSILHNDATPNLTHSQILEYRQHLVLFVEGLLDILGTSIENFKQQGLCQHNANR